MTGVRAAVLAAALAVSVGCGGSDPGPGTTPTAAPVGAADCPPVHGSGYAAIDYVDFIQAFDQQYVAGLTRLIRVYRADLGRVVLRSRCSFSALNDRTHKSPGEPRNGDTAFLKPGTPIYAINGWSPRCRLAAHSPVGLVAYLAMKPHARNASPRACAVRQ